MASADQAGGGTPGEELVDQIESEFAGDDRPVTVEMLSDVYQSLVLIQEALISLSLATRKAVPDVQDSEEWRQVQHILKRSIETLGKRLVEISPDDRGDHG